MARGIGEGIIGGKTLNEIEMENLRAWGGGGGGRLPQNAGEGLADVGNKLFEATKFNRMMALAKEQRAADSDILKMGIGGGLGAGGGAGAGGTGGGNIAPGAGPSAVAPIKDSPAVANTPGINTSMPGAQSPAAGSMSAMGVADDPTAPKMQTPPPGQAPPALPDMTPAPSEPGKAPAAGGAPGTQPVVAPSNKPQARYGQHNYPWSKPDGMMPPAAPTTPAPPPTQPVNEAAAREEDPLRGASPARAGGTDMRNPAAAIGQQEMDAWKGGRPKPPINVGAMGLDQSPLTRTPPAIPGALPPPSRLGGPAEAPATQPPSIGGGLTMPTQRLPYARDTRIPMPDLTQGKSRSAAGWAASNPTWQGLDDAQRAAAMGLMEADGRNPTDARNAVGSMINRAAKTGERLGSHVSGRIYQPTIEPTQGARLNSIVQSPQFNELTNWTRSRMDGMEVDPVEGNTHFLAPEKTMLALSNGVRMTPQGPRGNSSKYHSWPSWSGFDMATGQYTNPDGSPIFRDKSHAFRSPEGRYVPSGGQAPFEMAGGVPSAGMQDAVYRPDPSQPTPQAEPIPDRSRPGDYQLQPTRQSAVDFAGQRMALGRGDVEAEMDAQERSGGIGSGTMFAQAPGQTATDAAPPSIGGGINVRRVQSVPVQPGTMPRNPVGGSSLAPPTAGQPGQTRQPLVQRPDAPMDPNDGRLTREEYDRRALAIISNDKASAGAKAQAMQWLEQRRPLTTQDRLGLEKTQAEIDKLRREGTEKPMSVPENSSVYLPPDANNPNGRWAPPPPNQGGLDRKVQENYAKEHAAKQAIESGKQYSDAQNTLRSVADLRQLQDLARTGSLSEFRQLAARMGSTFGLTTDKMNDRTAATELFKALSQQFVVSQAQSLKPLSDSDIKFIQQGVAQVERDPRTLQVMLPVLARVAERQAMTHDLIRKSAMRGVMPDLGAIEAHVNEQLPSVIGQQFPQLGGTRVAPGSGMPRSAAPGAPTTPGAPAAAPGGDDPIARARAAIQQGAPRAEVERRLRQNGIDPRGL